MSVEGGLAVDLASSFKLIFILTTAIYAIAHYYDSRQKNLLKDEKDKLLALDLRSAEDNDGMQIVKNDIAGLINEESRNNQCIIIALWCMFVTYTILLACILAPFYVVIANYSYILWFLSLFLVVLSITLSVQLKRMKNQLYKFRADVSNTITKHNAVKVTIQSIGNHQGMNPESPETDGTIPA